MKKIKAFTLSELLVVIIISSIVVSLSFLALQNVQSQVRNIITTFEKQQEINRLERWLQQDLNQYACEYDEGRKALSLKNSKGEIEYLFGKEIIKRNQDSVVLTVTKLQFYLDGSTVEKGKIDAVEMNFANIYSQRQFFVYKRKDASFYLNQ